MYVIEGKAGVVEEIDYHIRSLEDAIVGRRSNGRRYSAKAQASDDGALAALRQLRASFAAPYVKVTGGKS